MHHNLRNGTCYSEEYSDEMTTANKCINTANKIERAQRGVK